MRWDWKVLAGAVIAAVVAGWLLTRSVERPAADLDDVDRDLVALAQTLRTGADVELELVPRTPAGLRLPSALNYQRPSNFWRPVIGRAPRRGRS